MAHTWLRVHVLWIADEQLHTCIRRHCLPSVGPGFASTSPDCNSKRNISISIHRLRMGDNISRLVLWTLTWNLVVFSWPLKTKNLKYPRCKRCFSPDNIPGVSMSVGLDHAGKNEASNRLKKAFPNDWKAPNCRVGSTAKAFPGVACSLGPCMMAMKRSVVGSGPILIPGKAIL